jgi:hypothetical protein
VSENLGGLSVTFVLAGRAELASRMLRIYVCPHVYRSRTFPDPDWRHYIASPTEHLLDLQPIWLSKFVIVTTDDTTNALEIQRQCTRVNAGSSLFNLGHPNTHLQCSWGGPNVVAYSGDARSASAEAKLARNRNLEHNTQLEISTAGLCSTNDENLDEIPVLHTFRTDLSRCELHRQKTPIRLRRIKIASTTVHRSPTLHLVPPLDSSLFLVILSRFRHFHALSRAR